MRGDLLVPMLGIVMVRDAATRSEGRDDASAAGTPAGGLPSRTAGGYRHAGHRDGDGVHRGCARVRARVPQLGDRPAGRRIATDPDPVIAQDPGTGGIASVGATPVVATALTRERFVDDFAVVPAAGVGSPSRELLVDDFIPAR